MRSTAANASMPDRVRERPAVEARAGRECRRRVSHVRRRVASSPHTTTSLSSGVSRSASAAAGTRWNAATTSPPARPPAPPRERPSPRGARRGTRAVPLEPVRHRDDDLARELAGVRRRGGDGALPGRRDHDQLVRTAASALVPGREAPPVSPTVPRARRSPPRSDSVPRARDDVVPGAREPRREPLARRSGRPQHSDLHRRRAWHARRRVTRARHIRWARGR